ncbi:MAG: prepilin-type N-terminal cleavage/methylation domain-containing protein [Planctomycetes bacterium]|nr:prepilin-type N-terminal cleavage/methylation domain-containing protein [Planctomycetota bacterium]
MIKANKQKAFTLIEVLASVIILSGSIVTIITYSADGLATSLDIERRIKATLLAETEMEKIKNVLHNAYDTDFTAWSGALGNDYLATRTATVISATLKTVEVSVGYDVDGNGSLAADEIMVTLTTKNADRT